MAYHFGSSPFETGGTACLTLFRGEFAPLRQVERELPTVRVGECQGYALAGRSGISPGVARVPIPPQKLELIMPVVQMQREQTTGAGKLPKFRSVAASVKPPLPKKSLPGRGRPCLLTTEREGILLKAIEDGLPLKQAAMLAGISYDTFNRWRIKGESESAPDEFRDFCKALRHSEAIAMQRLVGRIQSAGETDWKASAWMLEKRFPDEFGKPQRIEHSGPDGKPIQAMTTVEPEVLQRIKKQAGIVEVLAKFGTILLKNRATKNLPRLRE